MMSSLSIPHALFYKLVAQPVGVRGVLAIQDRSRLLQEKAVFETVFLSF